MHMNFAAARGSYVLMRLLSNTLIKEGMYVPERLLTAWLQSWGYDFGVATRLHTPRSQEAETHLQVLIPVRHAVSFSLGGDEGPSRHGLARQVDQSILLVCLGEVVQRFLQDISRSGGA